MRKALDLFCCEGGASYGISLNDFNLVGVDINTQKNYPFEFIRSDVFELPLNFFDEFDYIWASPPCQGYSCTKNLHNGKHPMLIERVRDLLIGTNKYWTIENVVGAPLIDPILLCGTMFNLRTYRHRLFESNFKVDQLSHPKHIKRSAKLGYAPTNNQDFMTICGHFPNLPLAKEIIGHDWMSRYGLSQCIPYKYSEYISKFVPK